MARTVKFKDENESLIVIGMGKVDKHNLTPELYDRLLKRSPGYAQYFIVKETKEVNEKQKPNEVPAEKK